MMAVRNSEFNSASSLMAAGDAASSNTMALVIDVQDFARMDAADARNYAEHLASNLTALRASGVPVTWVTMRKDAQLYEPTPSPSDSAPQVRNLDQLREMGFHGIDADHENSEIFRDFITNFGPRNDEAVSVKSVKSALVERADAEGRPDYQNALATECGEPFDTYFTGGKTLAEYMGDVDNTILMGAVSSHCISETAVSAAIKGRNPVIVTDAVLSWQGDDALVNPRSSVQLWRGTGGNSANFDAFHQGKINAAISSIASDNRRGFTSDQVAAISKIGFVSSAALGQQLQTSGAASGAAYQPVI